MQTLPAWVPLPLPRLLPVNSFPVRSPQLACTSFVQFDGVVCGFCPGLSLSLSLFYVPAFLRSFLFIFCSLVKAKVTTKVLGALHWQLLVALKVSHGGA